MSTADLIEVIDSLGMPKLVVVGDLILDHYVFGNVSRVSPEAPIPVLHVDKEEDVLGGAANVASNISSMGGKSVLIGVLGKDEAADRFREISLSVGGLKLDTVTCNQRPTIRKTRMVSQNQQMLRVDRENLDVLNDKQMASLLGKYGRALKGAKAVIISDYAKGAITGESAQQIIKQAKAVGIPVLVDPKGRDYSKYTGATAVTPNRGEAEAATGIDCSTLAGVEKAGRYLCRKLKLKAACITLSADGVAVIPAKGKMAHFTNQARSVFDVTGAGDTFIATFALAVGSGIDFDTAAFMANH
ncbi:MAG: PfkB family carbohydrate kinase, partial [Planctomycetota bacterium]